MNIVFRAANPLIDALNRIGEWLPQLGLRALIAYEFWLSGVEKWRGENWFGDVMDMFLFPFNVVPTDISWAIATWSELIGAVALVVGLGTRFFAAAFIVLDLVAWYTVHAGLGYNVCDNGFQLPLMYLIMLLPLLFSGPGKASVDYLVARRFLA
ncbi:MAG: HvfX family Cu-binding RiPP maturation protein [Gammaproteobacteria bacterium]